jgi:hypothetical protein
MLPRRSGDPYLYCQFPAGPRGWCRLHDTWRNELWDAIEKFAELVPHGTEDGVRKRINELLEIHHD